MGLFDKFFGTPKSSLGSAPEKVPASPPASTTITTPPATPPLKDDLDSLSREQVVHGGKVLSRRYWSSIYLGAYAPTMDMGILKGTNLATADAARLVECLHEAFGKDDLGNTSWTDEDADNLEGNTLERSWTVADPVPIHINLSVDNFHPSDDPVMLSIRPWATFREIMHARRL